MAESHKCIRCGGETTTRINRQKVKCEKCGKVWNPDVAREAPRR